MEPAVPESKPKQQFTDPGAGPLLSVRFGVALLLMAVGIAWVLYYYIGVRPDPTVFDSAGKPVGPGGPNFMGDLKDWNYLIGFGLLFLGLIASAHPKTPLGRGRGVVVGMMGCFILGLLWICTFYVISDDVSELAVFNDLGQKNLIVGIAFMAVGFTFATRWE
jgi:hypothetical protein